MFEGSSMLLDVLAVVIAFSAVMLLLSLLVTSLAQATQASLRLRSRNLQTGLAAILEPRFGHGSRDLAASLLNSPEISVLRQRKDPTSWLGRLRGPYVSWVEPEQLREALEKAQGDGTSKEGEGMEEPAGVSPAVVSKIDVDETVKRFKRLDEPLSKRFALAMRVITVCWALVVAVGFQVSTPTLLQKLSTDPEYRASLVEQADEILQYGGEALGRLEVQNASESALERLMKTHPELRSEIEETTGDYVHPEASAEDLQELLEGMPERASRLHEFEGLMTEELEEQRDRALAEGRGAVDQLAAINIAPWPEGKTFYWDRGLRMRNLLGVLATAILLTLGAPFWYEVLKNTTALRDLLAPKKKDRKGAGRQGIESTDSTEDEVGQ